MKLGILETDHVNREWVAQHGEYPDMFVRLLMQVDPTLEWCAYDVTLGRYPKDLDEVDAYLITGSRFSVYDDKEWIRTLGAFVQKLYKAKKKVIGICFGHQLVAHFLGGKTEASPKGWGIGLHNYKLTEHGRLFTNQEKDFKLIVSHRDQVVIPATDTTILAESHFCPVAMCLIGDSIFTTQGHPEFEASYFDELLSSRQNLYDDTHYQKAKNSISKSNDSLLVAKWIIDFIK